MSQRGSLPGSGLASGNSSASTAPNRPKACLPDAAAVRGSPVSADAPVVFTAPENTTHGDGHSGRPCSKLDGISMLNGRKGVKNDTFSSAEQGSSVEIRPCGRSGG